MQPAVPSARPDAAAPAPTGEDGFRAMFEASSVGMVQADPATRRFLRVNAAFCAITGYSPPELLAMTIDDVTHPEDRAADREHFLRLVAGETAECRFAKRYRRKDGGVAWVELTANLIRDDEGRPLRTVALIQDVTPRKAAEEALRESEEWFRTSVETLLDPFAIYEAARDEAGEIVDFRTVYVNAAACAANRMTREEQVGRLLCELLPAHRASGLFDEYRQVVETGEPLRKECLEYEDDYNGQRLRRAFDVQVAKLGDGFAASWRDITPRKQAEERLVLLQAVTAALNAATTPAEVYRAALHGALGLGATGGALYLLEGETLVLADATGFDPELLEHYQRVALDAPIPMTDAVRGAAPVWLSSRAEYARRYPHLAEHIRVLATEAAVSFPLLLEGTVLGALNFTFANPLDLDAGMRDTLLLLSVLVGRALERSALYAAAAAASERFARAEEAAGAFSYEWDAATGRIERTAGVRAVLGFAPDEIVPTWDAWNALVHPDDQTLTKDEVLALHAGQPNGEPVAYEYRVRHKDGSYRWLSEREVPVRDAEGRVRRVVGHAVDVTARKEAEAGLRRSEERLRLAAEISGLGFHDFDATTGISYWTPELYRINGLAPDTVVTFDTVVALLHPEDRERIAARMRDALDPAGTGEFTEEFRIVRPDTGQTRWVANRSQTVFEGRGPGRRAVRNAGVVADVTERKEAEEALRESESRFRTMADETPVIIWATDAAGGIEFVNRAYTEYFGVTEEEVHGPNWQPLMHPDDAETYAEAFFAALREGIPFHAEVRVRRADGAWRWIESFGAPRFSTRGELLGIVGSSPDVTERKEAEARFRGLFAGVADAILVADAEGRYLDANPAALALLGYAREELLGMGVADVVAEAPAWTAAEYARYRDEGFWRGELELRRKDGLTVTVEALATVVDLPTGRMYLSAVRDVSERKRDEAERVAFLDALAHDVKNPLGVAGGQAQLLRRRLRRGVSDRARLEESLDAIETAVAGATSLIDELLDVARLRAGQPLELRWGTVDLVALAEASAAEARTGHPGREVRVAAEVATLVGAWDAARLRRVLANLLGNAVKYSPGGGEVVVRVRQEEDAAGAWAVVAVQDRGVGIPASDLSRIFERFQRGGNVAAIGGAGIGLAGAKQIVAQHGGTIAVASEEDVGSTFTVRLPMS